MSAVQRDPRNRSAPADSAEDMRHRAQQLRRLAAQERDLFLSATFRRLADGFERRARERELLDRPAGHA